MPYRKPISFWRKPHLCTICGTVTFLLVEQVALKRVSLGQERFMLDRESGTELVNTPRFEWILIDLCHSRRHWQEREREREIPEDFDSPKFWGFGQGSLADSIKYLMHSSMAD